MKAIQNDPLIKVYIEKVTVEIEKEMNMREVINNGIIDYCYDEGVNIYEFPSLNCNPVKNLLKKVHQREMRSLSDD